MELEKLFGLPAHPLLVHAPVVLIPLAGIIAVVFAFKPAWLDRYGWGLVALAGVGALGGILAAGSGEGLASLQNQAETGAREDHFELGEIARNLGILFFVIVLAVVLVRHLARKKAATDGVWAKANSKGAAIAMSVLLVAGAAGATITISQAGHQGAKLVWEDEGKGESDTGDGD
jgi:uncharacterized membrane protein